MVSGKRSNASVISYTPRESCLSVLRSPRAICFPLLMMRMSSQSSSASLRTCVVRMMVLPFSTSVRRRFITCRLRMGSIPEQHWCIDHEHFRDLHAAPESAAQVLHLAVNFRTELKFFDQGIGTARGHRFVQSLEARVGE